jgi:hypothetical protein
MSTDFLADLLANAQAKVAADAALKANRTKLKDKRLTEVERDVISATVRRWESQNDYKADALVFRCLHYVCTCGEGHFIGGQILLREVHTRIARTARFIPVAEPLRTDLPRQVDSTFVHTNICPSCCEQKGFQGRFE